MNKFLTYMVEKLGKGKLPTPTNIAWNISPKVNAVFRNGTKKDKEILFKGFIGEIDPKEALKVATRCHRRQTEEVKRAFELYDKECVIRENSVVVLINNEYKEYTGLLASKFMSKYNKVAFVLRKPDTTTYSGSFRSPVDILNLINSSGYANSKGHGCAAGFLCKASNLKRFLDWFDKQDLSEFTDEISVTAKLTTKMITTKLCRACVEHNDIWGHGIPEPTFYIKTTISPGDITIYEKKTTTIKITKDGVSFLKFFASPNDVEQLQKYNRFIIEMIVKLNVNEWNGTVYPQGEIVDFEVTNGSDFIASDDKNDSDWELDF